MAGTISVEVFIPLSFFFIPSYLEFQILDSIDMYTFQKEIQVFKLNCLSCYITRSLSFSIVCLPLSPLFLYLYVHYVCLHLALIFVLPMIAAHHG